MEVNIPLYPFSMSIFASSGVKGVLLSLASDSALSQKDNIF